MFSAGMQQVLNKYNGGISHAKLCSCLDCGGPPASRLPETRPADRAAIAAIMCMEATEPPPATFKPAPPSNPAPAAAPRGA